MNTFFLSLISKDKFERRKTRCSVYDIEEGESEIDSCYLKKRFNLVEGDIVVDENIILYWHGFELSEVPDCIIVSDHKFHPIYWREAGIISFNLSKTILDRISRTKFKKVNDKFFFSKVRIGKSRFNVMVMNSDFWNDETIVSGFKDSSSDQVTFSYEYPNLICWL